MVLSTLRSFRAFSRNSQTVVRPNERADLVAFHRAKTTGLLKSDNFLNLQKLYDLIGDEKELVGNLEHASLEKDPKSDEATLIGIRVDEDEPRYALVERINLADDKWFTVVLSKRAFIDLLHPIKKEKPIRAIKHELDHENTPMISSIDQPNLLGDYVTRRSAAEMNLSGRLTASNRMQFARDFADNRTLLPHRAAIEIDYFPEEGDFTHRFLSYQALQMLIVGSEVSRATEINLPSYAREHGDRLVSDEASNTHPVYCVEFPHDYAIDGKWVIRWHHDELAKPQNPSKGEEASSNLTPAGKFFAIPMSLGGLLRSVGGAMLRLFSRPKTVKEEVMTKLDKETSGTRVSEAKGEVIGRVMARFFFDPESYCESEVITSTLPNGDAVVMSEYMEGFKELKAIETASFQDKHLANAIVFLSVFNIDSGMSRSFLVDDETGQFSVIDLKNLIWDEDDPNFNTAKPSTTQEALMISGASEKMGYTDKKCYLANEFMIAKCEEFLGGLSDASTRSQIITGIEVEADVPRQKAQQYVNRVEENIVGYVAGLRELLQQEEATQVQFAEKLQPCTAETATYQTLNLQQAMFSVGEDQDLLITVMDAFLEEFTSMQPFTDAIESGNASEVRRLAHQIKGSAVYLTGEDSNFFRHAQELEEIGLNGDLTRASEVYELMEREVNGLKEDITLYKSFQPKTREM